MRARRLVPVAALGACALGAWTAAPAAAQERLPVTLPQCVAGAFVPGYLTPADGEGFGPTDVNAQSANGGMAAGLNRQGTLTVLRWPRPSYYDQVKYFTLDRNRPRFGAYPNEGAFLGLVSGGSTTWLRDWPEITQRFASPGEDAVLTTYRDPARGLEVSVTDVVPPGLDVLARRVEVAASPGAALPEAVVAFANFNLVVSKVAGLPGQDWCVEEQNVDFASYDPAADAVVVAKAGVDVSTGQPSSVAVAMGFDRPSSGFQVGGDAYEPTAAADGRLDGPSQDAYDDAADGRLRGNPSYRGQTTVAIAAPLSFAGGAASAELYVAAASGHQGAVGTLAAARLRGAAGMRADKAAWVDGQLASAPLPDTNDALLTSLARRALVLLVTTADRENAAIVASIATQPLYGEDWPRDSAFFNEALDRAGLHDLVRRHNLWLASLQATEVSQPRGSYGVPPGNWSMNYYADGVNGGPIPWEIDETGLAAWSLVRHFEWTGDRAYLEAVYPAVRRAADFLVHCRDPQTGLQCRATEDDNFVLYNQQTITGATTTWLGLDSAVRAAEALGQGADAARWRARRDELGAAIDAHLWDEAAGAYTGDYAGGAAYALWPAQLRPADPSRLQRHAWWLWGQLEPSFRAPASERSFGLYEAKGLIGLARLWRGDPQRLELVREGLQWIAHVQATADTGLLGETWKARGGEVITFTAVPHLWEHTLFYLASLDAYGERRP